MAGKITTIQPLGNQVTSRSDSRALYGGTQLPQQLGMTILGVTNSSIVGASGYGYNRTNYVASAPFARSVSRSTSQRTAFFRRSRPATFLTSAQLSR